MGLKLDMHSPNVVLLVLGCVAENNLRVLMIFVALGLGGMTWEAGIGC